MTNSAALILTDESRAVCHLNSFAFCLFTFAFLKVLLVGVNLFQRVDDEARLFGLVLVGL